MRERVEGPILVCGWLFGAHVALSTALAVERISALALLGPPLGDAPIPLPDWPRRAELKAFDRPVLLVAGEADQFCPLPDLRALGRKLTRATVRTVSDADHFFWRRERETAKIVGDFAGEALLSDQ
jgi:pimeloyl-ACP methyl ester carboxylesterase